MALLVNLSLQIEGGSQQFWASYLSFCVTDKFGLLEDFFGFTGLAGIFGTS